MQNIRYVKDYNFLSFEATDTKNKITFSKINIFKHLHSRIRTKPKLKGQRLLEILVLNVTNVKICTYRGKL